MSLQTLICVSSPPPASACFPHSFSFQPVSTQPIVHHLSSSILGTSLQTGQSPAKNTPRPEQKAADLQPCDFDIGVTGGVFFSGGPSFPSQRPCVASRWALSAPTSLGTSQHLCLRIASMTTGSPKGNRSIRKRSASRHAPCCTTSSVRPCENPALGQITDRALGYRV